MRVVVLLLVSGLISARSVVAQGHGDVPLGGNSWGDTVWVRLSHTGRLDISAVDSGGNVTAMPSMEVRDTGYRPILVKKGAASVRLSGPAAAEPMAYVRNNEGNFFYWGRRGPSVHLNYPVPDSFPVKWFYNEVTVPAGKDVIGSYFMADGFSVGYFGMQMNSAHERRILFSVWSPFTTDDPKAIPDSLKIGLMRKGDSVHAGTFGDEGAGGQSYLVYPWKAGNTYRFLLCAEPFTEGRHTRF